MRETAVLFFWEQHGAWQYSVSSPNLRRTGWLWLSQDATDSQILAELKKWEPGFYGEIERAARIDGGA